ncbi:MAG: EAL domain-containing protein [Devosiaceae bacterium]|nr:EAL domain-containing protein [Devosiaceae bacterium]
MQLLIYIFIFLLGLALAFGAYLGLSFTPIEALLLGIIAISLAIVIFERTLRRRAEERFEKGIEDLSRLLSTNAQAGQVLSKRMNKMIGQDSGNRLGIVEADVSVLGSVVRQVAEAVAQLEEAQAKADNASPSLSVKQEIKNIIDPIVPIKDVKKALDDGRVIIHASEIIGLPKRQVQAYDLIPHMQLENGQMKKAADFIPQTGSENMVRKIDQLGFKRVFEYLENANEDKNAKSDLIPIHVPISKATLSDTAIVEWIIAQLDISRDLAKAISFSIPETQFNSLNNKEKINLTALVEKGSAISIKDVKNLRMDFADLRHNEVSSVRANSTIFINKTEELTDYEASDVASYISRFGIDLIMSSVQNEEQILSLLEDGISFISGEYVSPAKPALSVLKHFENRAATG